MYDPTAATVGANAADWRASYVTNDWHTFSALFWRNRHCFVVIDEAAKVYREKESRKDAVQMLQMGRHVMPSGGGGHTVAIIAQRYTGLERDARDQTSILYAFGQSWKDGEQLADDWNVEALRNVHKLPNLHYIRTDTDYQTRRGRVELPK